MERNPLVLGERMTSAPHLLSLAATPFRTDAAIDGVLSQVLGLSGSVVLKSLPYGMLFSEFPMVKSRLEALGNSCDCGRCFEGCCDLSATYKQCLRNQFFHNIACIVQDILCISLFDCPKSLLVSLHQSAIRGPFESAVYSILTEGKAVWCRIDSVLHWALALIGHDMGQFGALLSIIPSAGCYL